MASPIVSGFSLTHAEILDGTKDFLSSALMRANADERDIYGVSEAGIDLDTDDYTNEGDDVELEKWFWGKSAEVEVQAGYISFPLIGSLTGRAISSSGSGADQVFGIDLWHEDDFNVAPKPMIMSMLSKDHLGVTRSLTIGLYRVQFGPMTFDGPQYKEGLKVNYNGTALFSPVDEKGQPFADGKKRIGRLLSHK